MASVTNMRYARGGGEEDEKYMTGRKSRLNAVPRIGGRYGKWKDDKLREGVLAMTGGG